MTRIAAALAAALVSFAAAGGARAQSSRTQAAPVTAEPATESVPQLGVDPRPRRGTYAETSLGVFLSTGGSAGVSNAQAYIGMAVGRDLGESAAIFAQLGIGASSANCFDPVGADCHAADSFGLTFLELGFQYAVEVAPRLRLGGQLLGGVTLLAPSPIYDTTARNVPDRLFGPHGGVGVSLDYDTHLDHFAVGLNFLARYTLASNPNSGTFGLFSLALMPRVRYVF